MKSAKHWLVPGGFLLGVFFTDPPPREDGASGPPFGVSLDELRGLFGESFTIRREQSPDRSHLKSSAVKIATYFGEWFTR